MKLLATLIALAFTFAACNNKNSETPAGAGHDHADAAKTEATLQATETTGSTSPGLTLNNGEKWKADESTNNNVASIEKMVVSFNDGKEKKLEDYKALHASLRSGVEKMVKECRMKGADHDALHLWLEPLMGMVKQLGNVTSAEEGAASVEKINNQVKLYPQYFA